MRGFVCLDFKTSFAIYSSPTYVTPRLSCAIPQPGEGDNKTVLSFVYDSNLTSAERNSVYKGSASKLQKCSSVHAAECVRIVLAV